MEILMKEPNLILGENYKNLDKIIIIISKVYKTEGCDEETNNNIKKKKRKLPKKSKMK
jgi:hypothetical protein